MQKYLFKALYNEINNKVYNLQIWQYNMCNTNIITLKNLIILEKFSQKEKQFIIIPNRTVSAKISQVLNHIDLAGSYKQVISNDNYNTVIKLGLTGVKKY